MHDIETKKQVKVAKHDNVNRLAHKDKFTEKLSDCGKRPQHSPDGDLNPFNCYFTDMVDVKLFPEYNELTHFGDYSYLYNKNSGQSGEYHFGEEYEPTAEEKFFYGW